MQKKYDQLYSWVKCGMVPTYQDGQFIEENPVISRGRLSNVWLGGLVNPQALLTALRQEKAVVSKCHLSDVSMRIHFNLHARKFFILFCRLPIFFKINFFKKFFQ